MLILPVLIIYYFVLNFMKNLHEIALAYFHHLKVACVKVNYNDDSGFYWAYTKFRLVE